MNAALTKSPAQSMEIALVLQGGGALGAYEYGGITGLFDVIDEAAGMGQNVTLKAVTGVSIGAINAACVVGARDRADARKRLKALWNDLTIAALPFVPSAVTDNVPLWYVPHFYTFQPTLTSLYNTHPLLGTLANHVDFTALNASATTFVITAADVESGELKRFANRDVGRTKGIAIEPHHVLASGSLPPQFPWTDIGSGSAARHYWDGGVVDNTPLGDAIDAFSGADVQRVLVIMNLFPLAAKPPRSFAEVSDRVNQLRFGNRLRQDKSTADQFNELIETIGSIAQLVPGGLPAELQAKATKYKRVETVEISFSGDAGYEDQNGFRDFSRDGVERRRATGYKIAREILRTVFKFKAAA
jgi:predicted acylesterase/phospholipase RssA